MHLFLSPMSHRWRHRGSLKFKKVFRLNTSHGQTRGLIFTIGVGNCSWGIEFCAETIFVSIGPRLDRLVDRQSHPKNNVPNGISVKIGGARNQYVTCFLTTDYESACSETLESTSKQKKIQKWPKIWSVFSEFWKFLRKLAGVFDAQMVFAIFFLISYSPVNSASRSGFKNLAFSKQPVQNPGRNGQTWFFFHWKGYKIDRAG